MDRADVFIVGGARTPMAAYVGVLKECPAAMLGAVASRAALDRSQVRPEWVEHVVFGQVLLSSGGGIYSTRHMALDAGIPIDVPAFTVNRLCGSGLQAAVSGAQMIIAGDADVVLAGGMESMSQAPHLVPGLRGGLRLADGALEDSLLASLHDSRAGCAMAQTAENCATKYGITREAQDAYAVRSQQLAAQAWDSGRLSEEVVPIELKTRKGPVAFARDDHLRADTTLEGLAKLRPVLSPSGTVTAGNASGIVDGAAALVLASGAAVSRYQLKPLARLSAWAVRGVEPTLMGMGPVPATQALLQKTGLRLEEVDLVDVNEAFAAQYLAVEQVLGLDRNKVNVNGGAIALGHPLGMTGARQLLTLSMELRRRGGGRGVATACIGGGQGIAALVETGKMP